MNNGKHTPGPWRVVPCTLEGAGALRRDIISDGAEFSPAYVGGDILEDDARLIAAAPDILEALRELLAERCALEEPEQFDAAGNWTSDSPASKKARAAIRKAIGGE